MVTNWREAVEISKIPRINYKKILGKSFSQYMLDNKYTKDDEILKEILLLLKKPENKIYLNGVSLIKASENLRIGISARRAEQKIYG